MRARNLGPLGLVVLSLCAPDVGLAQEKTASYEDELQAEDASIQRREYEQALRYDKHAYALTDKTSYEALGGMVVSYNGLAAYKNASSI